MSANELRLSCRVDAHRAGRPLLEFLALRFRYHAEEKWAERIGAGSVTVNGHIVPASYVVTRDDVIGYTILHEEPPVDFRYEVLHEDADLLAVAKSGNLPVHAAGRYIRHTLMAKLAERYAGPLQLVHRLDKETSGVVLVARRSVIARELEACMRAKRFRKQYVAVLAGELTAARVVERPIARDGSSRAPRFHVEQGGKAARTRFEPLGYGRLHAAGGAPITFARIVPETGRTHQIRVHARAIGHDVVGDKVYSRLLAPGEDWRFRSAEEALAGLGAARQLLHCAEIEVDGRGGRLTFRCEPPEEFREAWGEALPG